MYESSSLVTVTLTTNVSHYFVSSLVPHVGTDFRFWINSHLDDTPPTANVAPTQVTCQLAQLRILSFPPSPPGGVVDLSDCDIPVNT